MDISVPEDTFQELSRHSNAADTQDRASCSDWKDDKKSLTSFSVTRIKMNLDSIIAASRITPSDRLMLRKVSSSSDFSVLNEVCEYSVGCGENSFWFDICDNRLEILEKISGSEWPILPIDSEPSWPKIASR